MLSKLRCFGIFGDILKWINTYISGRTLLVNIDGVLSSPYIATSGVPQGSHLGPILFILFVNDIEFFVKSAKCLIYADDVKLYKRIKSINDAEFLQRDIDGLGEWCAINCLFLNPVKCKVMTFNRARSKFDYIYSVGNYRLVCVNNILDLGVLYDSECRFNCHVEYAVQKAYKMLGFIRRNAKDFRDPCTLKVLYCSLVRSVLEYASVVWSPYHFVHIRRIEMVQKSFTRFALRDMNFAERPSYLGRCRLLGLDYLVDRRKRFGVIFVSDLLTSRIQCPELLSSVPVFAPERVLRNFDFIRLPFHRTEYASQMPLLRAFRNFNDCYTLFDFNISRNQFNSLVRNWLTHNF